MTTETTTTKPARKPRAAKAKPAARKAKTTGKTAKAKDANLHVSTVRPRGEKWEAARKLLTATGGADRADLFAALKWRSMDQNLLAKGTGLKIEKLESGKYAGK